MWNAGAIGLRGRKGLSVVCERVDIASSIKNLRAREKAARSWRQQFSIPRRNAGLNGFLKITRRTKTPVASAIFLKQPAIGYRGTGNGAQSAEGVGLRAVAVRGFGMRATFELTVLVIRDADPHARCRGLCVRWKPGLKTITLGAP